MHPPPASRIRVCCGDITSLAVDAIVTAANESLAGGGGVDGAVHRAAGPGFFEECRTLGICPEGEARITGGHLLPARHVIHAVGPVWEDGTFGESETLTSCYLSALQLASDHRLREIAFPCIATGTYQFPRDLACEIAVAAVTSWLNAHEFPQQVVFCCFEEEDFDLYRQRV